MQYVQCSTSPPHARPHARTPASPQALARSLWQGRPPRPKHSKQASKRAACQCLTVAAVATANITLPALLRAAESSKPNPTSPAPALAPETFDRGVTSTTAGLLSSTRSDAVVPPSLVLGPRAACCLRPGVLGPLARFHGLCRFQTQQRGKRQLACARPR